MPNATSKMVRPSFAGAVRSFVLQPVDDGRTIFDVALGMFRLHMGESEGTSHSQHGVGDHERPVRVARDPAEAEIRLPIALHHPIGCRSGGTSPSRGCFGLPTGAEALHRGMEVDFESLDPALVPTRRGVTPNDPRCCIGSKLSQRSSGELNARLLSP